MLDYSISRQDSMPVRSIASCIGSRLRVFLLTYVVLGLEPSFDVPIVNVTVVAGQTAVLPCSVDSLGKYKVR